MEIAEGTDRDKRLRSDPDKQMRRYRDKRTSVEYLLGAMATLERGEELEAVEAALRIWDPIGVLTGPISTQAPRDEYDGYAPALLELLYSDATEEDLAAHLAQVRFEIIGVGPEHVAEPELDLSRSLCAWRGRGYPNEWSWELAADGT